VTIERGRDWGRTGPLPERAVVVGSDAEAARVIEAARRAGAPLPALGLLGGDLCRTLGGTGDEARLRSGSATIVPVDLGVALVDGVRRCFCAHLVARRRLWRGRVVVVMNAQCLGPYDLAPRGHPNDGMLDITEGALPIGDLVKARRRARTGTHVPHPALREWRTKAAQFDLDRGMEVWLDGVRIGPARALSVRVEPDALTVVV
jgi:hypothetical protein